MKFCITIVKHIENIAHHYYKHSFLVLKIYCKTEKVFHTDAHIGVTLAEDGKLCTVIWSGFSIVVPLCQLFATVLLHEYDA